MKTIIKFISKRRLSNIASGVVCASLIQVVCMAPAQADDTDSYLKDLDIRQVAMAQIDEPRTTSEESVSPAKLRVSASLDRADHTYRHGEKVVLTVTTTKDAYVWVYDTGTSGKVHQIYPNEHDNENFVRANYPVTIPGSGSYDFVVSHPAGSELLTIIASTSDSPLTNQFVDSTSGPFLALRGTAESVAKDISVSLHNQHSNWDKDVKVLRIY